MKIIFSILFSLCSLSLLAGGGKVNYLEGDSDFETTLDALVMGPFSYGTARESMQEKDLSRLPWYEIDHTTGYKSASSLKLVNGATRCPTELYLPKGKWTYSCYMRSDKPNGRAVFMVLPRRTPWIGENGILARRGREFITVGKEWKRYTLTFESDGVSSYIPYVGGWNKGYGTIYLDRIMVSKGTQVPEWNSPSTFRAALKLNAFTGNIHEYNKPLNLNVRLMRYAEMDPKEPLRITVKDFYQKVLKEYTTKPVFKNGVFTADYSMPVGKSGYFLVEASMPGMTDVKLSYILVRPCEKIAPGLQPFVGLCAIQWNPKAGRMLGVGRADMTYAWRGHVDENNKFNALYELKRMKEHGYFIKAMMVSSPPEKLQPKSVLEAARKVNIPYTSLLPQKELVETKWREYVRDFAEKTHKIVDVYELSGEMDAMIGYNTYYKSLDGGKNMVGSYVTGESMDILSHCVRVGAQEILKFNPKARISGIRPCDCDSRDGFIYSSEVFKRAGKYLNTFGADCYPNPRWIGPGRPAAGTEEALEFVYRKGMEAMKKYCKGADMYISEYGYFVDFRHIFEHKYLHMQANRLLRSYLKAKALGFSGLDYFSALSRSGGGEGKYYYFGIWWTPTVPLPAVATLATAGRIVDNVTKAEDIKLKNELGTTLYRKVDGRAVAAFWSVDDKERDISIPDNSYTMMDAMGNPLPVRKKNGRIELRLTSMPVFLWSEKKGADNYSLLRKSVLDLRLTDDIPLNVEFRCQSRKSGKAYVKNLQLRKAVSGKYFTLCNGKKSAGKSFRIEAGKEIILPIPMPKAGSELQLEFIFDDGYAPMSRSFRAPEFIRVVRQNGLKLDGTLATWKKIPAVIVSGSDRIQPMDGTTYDGPNDISAKMYFANDGKYFYFAADVVDDRHFNNGSSAWDGDGIQCAFDPETNHVTRDKSLDGDDSAFSLALTAKKGANFRVYLSPRRRGILTGSQWKVVRNEQSKKTLYQVKIPLKEIGPALKKDSVFGFTCCVFDDDSGAKADYWLYLSYGLAGGVNPALFSQLILE